MPATNEEFIKKAFESGLTEDQVRKAVAERNQMMAQKQPSQEDDRGPVASYLKSFGERWIDPMKKFGGAGGFAISQRASQPEIMKRVSNYQSQAQRAYDLADEARKQGDLKKAERLAADAQRLSKLAGDVQTQRLEEGKQKRKEAIIGAGQTALTTLGTSYALANPAMATKAIGMGSGLTGGFDAYSQLKETGEINANRLASQMGRGGASAVETMGLTRFTNPATQAGISKIAPKFASSPVASRLARGVVGGGANVAEDLALAGLRGEKMDASDWAKSFAMGAGISQFGKAPTRPITVDEAFRIGLDAPKDLDVGSLKRLGDTGRLPESEIQKLMGAKEFVGELPGKVTGGVNKLLSGDPTARAGRYQLINKNPTQNQKIVEKAAQMTSKKNKADIAIELDKMSQKARSYIKDRAKLLDQEIGTKMSADEIMKEVKKAFYSDPEIQQYLKTKQGPLIVGEIEDLAKSISDDVGGTSFTQMDQSRLKVNRGAKPFYDSLKRNNFIGTDTQVQSLANAKLGKILKDIEANKDPTGSLSKALDIQHTAIEVVPKLYKSGLSETKGFLSRAEKIELDKPASWLRTFLPYNQLADKLRLKQMRSSASPEDLQFFDMIRGYEPQKIDFEPEKVDFITGGYQDQRIKAGEYTTAEGQKVPFEQKVRPTTEVDEDFKLPEQLESENLMPEIRQASDVRLRARADEIEGLRNSKGNLTNPLQKELDQINELLKKKITSYNQKTQPKAKSELENRASNKMTGYDPLKNTEKDLIVFKEMVAKNPKNKLIPDILDKYEGVDPRFKEFFDKTTVKSKPPTTKGVDSLIQEAKKYKSAEEFVNFMRGSATQYGEYNPALRAKYGVTDEATRISDLGVKPDLEVTIYRGVPDPKNNKIIDGDFVTTDKLSAESYAGRNNVVSKKVKAEDLIADYPSEFDSKNPFAIGSEFVYSDSKNKLTPLTDDQLTDIYNQAKGVEPLIQEAKKYKSAEEFVKAQSGTTTSGGYTSRGLSQAIEMRKTGGSLANYDNLSQKEWLGGKTPTKEITLYRATPNGENIKPGNYVTNDMAYAKQHIRDNLGGKGKITEIKATLDDIFPADGPKEFWYAPKEIENINLTDIYNQAKGKVQLGKADPLAKLKAEAKKYKSAEEFLYHGTNSDVLDNISKEGLKPGMSTGNISLSPNESYAKQWSQSGMTPQGKTEGVMLRVNRNLLKSEILPSKSGVKADQLNELISKDVIPPKAIEIKIGGKWQPLTDIYNQAKGKVQLGKADPLAKLKAEAKKYKSADEFVESQKKLVKNIEPSESVENVKVSILDQYKEFDRSTKPLPSSKIDELRADIQKNGIKDPIVIKYNYNDNTAKIVEGNHRLAIAKELGIEEIPTRVESVPSYTGIYRFGELPAKPVIGVKTKSGNIPEYIKPSDILRDKSQLTDIYNQAKGKSKTTNIQARYAKEPENRWNSSRGKVSDEIVKRAIETKGEAQKKRIYQDFPEARKPENLSRKQQESILRMLKKGRYR